MAALEYLLLFGAGIFCAWALVMTGSIIYATGFIVSCEWRAWRQRRTDADPSGRGER